MGLLRDLNTPGKAGYEKQEKRERLVEASHRLNESKMEKFISESDEAKKHQLSEAASCIGRKSKKRRQLLQERKILREEIEQKFSILMANIVLESTPIDPDSKSQFKEAILENTTKFTSGLFNNGLITLKSFTDNSAGIVRNVSEAVIREDLELVQEESEKIINAVAKKAEALIAAEIKETKKNAELIDEINAKRKSLHESYSSETLAKIGTHVLEESKAHVKLKGGIFTSLLNETSKEMINEFGELDMDKAAGEAAIKVTILEAFNTMNLASVDEMRKFLKN
jgi:hypothetical protein